MPTIQVNDANFYYELHGKGQPLILINGYTANHIYWLPILDELSRHFQVLIFDNRAAGKTTDDGRELSAELMADDVVALANTLQLKKPHILGISMGGAIAQCIASRYPDVLNKLVLLLSTAKWREAMLIGVDTALEMRKKNIDLDIRFTSIVSWIFGQEFLLNEKNINVFKKAWLENEKLELQSIVDQTRQYHLLKKFDGRNQLKKIKASTLIGYGIQDIIVLPDESHFLAQQIVNAKLIKFDCGHGIILERPRELCKAVIEFLL
jgi:pimeloyl-ACP methyl ester carboxylesterase